MAQTEAYKQWAKDNTVMITMRLQKTTDADILQFLEGKSKQTIIKDALREYIKNHTPAEDDIPEGYICTLVGNKYKREDDPDDLYLYGMRLRGYSPGAQPKGVAEVREDPTGKYYNLLVYDLPLSAEDVEQYELDELF